MMKKTQGKKRNYRFLTLVLAFTLLVCGVAGGTVAWLIANADPVVNTFTYGDIDITLDETKTDEDGNTVDENEDGNPDKTTEGNDYEMIPGKDYLKDPEVTVLAGSEACWLFVKLEEEGGVFVTNEDGTTTTVYGFADYLTYEIAEGWTQLLDNEGNPVEGVYYRYVESTEGSEDTEGTEDAEGSEDTEGTEDAESTEVAYKVLKDDKISVLDTVTKEMLNALDDNGEDTANATYPKLYITAYAVQYSGFETEKYGSENAAALAAWEAVEAQNATVTP